MNAIKTSLMVVAPAATAAGSGTGRICNRSSDFPVNPDISYLFPDQT